MKKYMGFRSGTSNLQTYDAVFKRRSRGLKKWSDYLTLAAERRNYETQTQQITRILKQVSELSTKTKSKITYL